MTNSIRIDNSGLKHYLQLNEAVILANELLQSDDFYETIAAHPHFDMADAPPETIAMLMKETFLKMHIDLYYAQSSSLDIDGYDDAGDPSAIHLNIWKINRTAASICNTLLHACVHAVNACNRQYNFGHGDRSFIGKENTAPYWIGSLAQSLVSGEEPSFLTFIHDPHQPAPRYYETEMAPAVCQSIWLTY